MTQSIQSMTLREKAETAEQVEDQGIATPAPARAKGSKSAKRSPSARAPKARGKATRHSSDPGTLNAEIRAMIPLVQEANLATCAADTKAIELGIEIETFPEWIEAKKGETLVQSEFEALCAELWRRPVTSFDDLLIRAEVAHHSVAHDWPWSSHEVFSPDALNDPPVCDSEAFGHLAIAVLALGGRRFEGYGSGDTVAARLGLTHDIVARAKAGGMLMTTCSDAVFIPQGRYPKVERWLQRRQSHYERLAERSGDEREEREQNSFHALVCNMMQKPVRTPEDLLRLAEITLYCCEHTDLGKIYPDDIAEEGSHGCMEEVSQACLARAVLDLIGGQSEPARRARELGLQKICNDPEAVQQLADAWAAKRAKRQKESRQ